MAPKNEKWKKAGKTLNLTKKQVAAGRRVGKAGQAKVRAGEVKKARKAVSISDTTWRKASERTGPRAKGGVLVGKDGKPVTGTVTLASGAKATYVRGKRVAAAKPKPRGGGGAGGGGGGRNIPTTRVTPSQRQEGAGGRPASTTYSGRTNDAAKARGLGRSSARSQGRNTAGRRAGERMTYRQKTPTGTFLITMEWDGTRWTQARKQRVSG